MGAASPDCRAQDSTESRAIERGEIRRQCRVQRQPGGAGGHEPEATAGNGSPAGSLTTNRVPFAINVSTSIVPPYAVTMPCTTDNPSPEPSRSVCVVQNGSQMRDRWSARIPGP